MLVGGLGGFSRPSRTDVRYCEQNGAFIAGFYRPGRLARNNPTGLGARWVGWGPRAWLTGTAGGIRTVVLEVKFLDYDMTTPYGIPLSGVISCGFPSRGLGFGWVNGPIDRPGNGLTGDRVV